MASITEIRQAAEADLEKFIRLVHPKRVLGAVHQELILWWNREERKSHQLVLLPRDHQKSAMIAYRVAWEITRNPAVRILYISSTSNLAVKQLKFIKDILTSKQYRRYWPEMVHEDEAKREKWTESEISVDHPKRREELIRDPTVFTAGLTTTITGMHCDIAVLDDVVVRENAYTEDGRTKVTEQYSLLSSIEGTDGREWVVGTRYHPTDLYHTLQSLEVEIYDEEGLYDQEASYKLYEVFERQVESVGDGTGEYLWPKQMRSDGTWFGFDQKTLARKRAQYIDKTQFRAQYYNDPNDVTNSLIPREHFQYYEKSYLTRSEGKWFFKGKRLNVFASVDFAYSINSRSDYTAIVVVGVDMFHNYYVLDIDRFKTGKISEYFAKILALHQKWDFRTLGAEVTAAQAVIVEDLKNNYIRIHGLALAVKDFKPGRAEGSKEERMKAVLQPRYENRQMWHYRGGMCQTLEDELVLEHPPHDDVKDALAACITICIPPTSSGHNRDKIREFQSQSHTRFGGIA